MANARYLVTSDDILRIEAVIERNALGYRASVCDKDHKATELVSMQYRHRGDAYNGAMELFNARRDAILNRMSEAQRAQYYADKDAEARALFAKL